MGNKAIIVALVAACGGGDDPGEDTCDPAADGCLADTICVVDVCEPVRPRVYRITNLGMRAPTTKPDGTPWDIGGGAGAAPDLFATIESVPLSGNPTIIANTHVTPDSFTAASVVPVDVDLEAGLIFRVFDEDATIDDAVFVCEANPLRASELRQRDLACETQGFAVVFRIEP